MNTEELKSAIRRYYDEAINRDDYRVIDELFARDVLIESPSSPPMHGREAIKEQLRMYRRAFPDVSSPIEDIISEGSKVVVRGSYVGTHEGELMGTAPTGRHVRVSFVDIWEVSDGKIIRGWSLADGVGMLYQLGLTRLPERMGEPMAA